MLAGLLLVILGVMLVLTGVYWASPYLATRDAASRLADRSMPATVSDDELQRIVGSLRSALDEVVPMVGEEGEDGVLAQVGRMVMQEARNQFLDEASKRFATREGIGTALYGWQRTSGSSAFGVRRGYAEFPDWFSVVMVDEANGAMLAELVYARDGTFGWRLVAVRPVWVRAQWQQLFRDLVRIGIEKVLPPHASTPRP